ncbi:MAG TPA: alpha/beta hydrolase, partial [Anaerolineae bacterium]
EGAALKEVTINTRIVQAQFTKHFGKPGRTYLYGFSRGAHNMTKLVETSPARYDGVFTVCGGNGGSQLQWDYFFTARVLFDYFFPGVLPGDVLNTPELDQERFFAEVAPIIADAIVANPSAAEEMAAVDQYDLQYNDFNELVSGIVQSLWPHTVGVNDLLLAARGNPFDNTQTVYTGTRDDEALNAGVARLSAEPQARNYLRVWYEPDGSIAGTPVLALHTTRDPVVPERPNNDKYETLVQSTGNADFFVRRRVERFGHCTFGGPELLGHFLDLVTWAETGVRPSS